MITLGQVIAYGIDAGFANIHGGWRWMVGLGAVPAGIQFLLLLFLPESRTLAHLHIRNSFIESIFRNLARILIRRGNMEDARNVMTKIYAYAKPEEVDLKVCVSRCC